jgi:putative ABC transport system ATP-binding protein
VAGTITIDTGQIRLAGRDVTDWPEHRRAGLIGRVFQDPYLGSAPHMTIAENLALAARRGRPRGLGWALSRAKRSEIAERVRRLGIGLENRLDNDVGSLSGGQRQALTLLMASWRRPELLLLDEHTAALDPKGADRVIALSDEIIRDGNLTAFMVTHSMHQAVHLGDRLLMMHRGQILEDFEGAAKRRLRTEALIDRFEEVRRSERLDETAAEMLRRKYV